jgi:hypothetical protein
MFSTRIETDSCLGHGSLTQGGVVEILSYKEM